MQSRKTTCKTPRRHTKPPRQLHNLRNFIHGQTLAKIRLHHRQQRLHEGALPRKSTHRKEWSETTKTLPTTKRHLRAGGFPVRVTYHLDEGFQPTRREIARNGTSVEIASALGPRFLRITPTTTRLDRESHGLSPPMTCGRCFASRSQRLRAELTWASLPLACEDSWTAGRDRGGGRGACVRPALRPTVGDDAHQPRFVRTVQRIGYRVVVSVASDACIACGLAHFVGRPGRTSGSYF